MSPPDGLLWTAKPQPDSKSGMKSTAPTTWARYGLGQVVRHRKHGFRGVVFDVDPVFSNDEDWYLSIPEAERPVKDQPFYHLLACTDDNSYVAYVSEQNLEPDDSGEPVEHPDLADMFGDFHGGHYDPYVALN